MTTTTNFAPGSVIENRSRLWRVDAQLGDTLLATGIDGESGQHRFYIPLENISPGRLLPPTADWVGHYQTQDLLLRAHRLSMLHGSAPLLSLQRSRVIPTNYQLIPVVMALDMPRVRMLIADDVGLGKTVEAGLIITELLARQRATRLLVVCPANLREQWREALGHFFHVDARIISSRHRRQMERQLPVGANPWRFYRYLIVSVDYAKSIAVRNQILEQEWDIVLFDEAHQVAKPHQVSAERVYMDRWELAQAIAESSRVRHLLLLTATPHNGYSDSFASLLTMLGVGATGGPPHAPVIHKTVARKYVCQRRRKDVEEWFKTDSKHSPFPKRDQDEVVIQPSETELTAIAAVEEYGNLILRNAEERDKGSVLAYWAVMHLHKRALSSPEALRRSLRNREGSLRRWLNERSEVHGEDVGLPAEVARANTFDEDPGERFSEEEAGLRLERGVYGRIEAIERELAALTGVMEKAQKVTIPRDSKLQHLLKNLLRERLRVYPRVIIFTRYYDTLEYLAGQIGKETHYAGVEIITLHGSLNETQRRERFRQFERAKKAIMIATDAISEGINLQHACNQVIHYELPWNPNRLEQRNGRVDRFGQTEDTVYIRTLVMNETLDAKILKVLVRKAEQIRADYGFAPPYFGDDANILDLIREQGIDLQLGPRQLDMFEKMKSAAPASAVQVNPFSDETLERIKEESFYGQTHIALPDIERRLCETAETVGSPAEIRSFVHSALNRFGCSIAENSDGTLCISLTRQSLQSVDTGSVLERATFDPELGLDDPDVQVLDLGHPLVRRLIDVVKQAAFTDPGFYGRTAYMVTSDVAEVTALCHVLARYVVRTEPVGIVEELLPVAFPVYGEGVLSRGGAGALTKATPTAETYSQAEVQEALAETLERPDLEEIIAGAIEERRRELVAERRTLRERLEREEGEEAARWLKGIDDLEAGSQDLLTVTIYYPG